MVWRNSAPKFVPGGVLSHHPVWCGACMHTFGIVVHSEAFVVFVLCCVVLCLVFLLLCYVCLTVHCLRRRRRSGAPSMLAIHVVCIPPCFFLSLLFFRLLFSMSVLCLFVRLFVCLFCCVCLFVCLLVVFVCLYVCVFIWLFVVLFVCFVCLFAVLFVFWGFWRSVVGVVVLCRLLEGAAYHE